MQGTGIKIQNSILNFSGAQNKNLTRSQAKYSHNGIPVYGILTTYVIM